MKTNRIVLAAAFAAASIGFEALAAADGSDCPVEPPTCTSAGWSPRCECERTCRYFGSCCAGQTDADGGGARLPKDAYTCEQGSDWKSPAYVIGKCASGSGLSLYAASLCRGTLQPQQYFDERFWPVTSNLSGLVYKSAYCALCNHEQYSDLQRWSASLRCAYGTDYRNATQRLSRCSVQFQPPGDYSLPRCWPDLVDYCGTVSNDSISQSTGGSASATVAMQEACNRAPQAVVQWGRFAIRNYHCAECSGLLRSQLNCSHANPGRRTPPRTPSRHEKFDLSLKVLLDPGGPLCQHCLSRSSSCKAYESYSWLTQMCEPLCPGSAPLLRDGNCRGRSAEATISTKAVITENAPRNETSPGADTAAAPCDVRNCSWAAPFDVRNCSWTAYAALIAALDAAAAPPRGVIDGVLYATLPGAAAGSALLCANCSWHTYPAKATMVALNGSSDIYVLPLKRRFPRPLARRHGDDVAVCLDSRVVDDSIVASDGGCGEVFEAIGVALMAASLVCLAVHAVAFFLLSALRNMPGKVVFSQVLALMLSYALFLARGSAVADAAVCYATAVAVHYFFLAYFVWTLVLAAEIHGAVRVLKKVYWGTKRLVAYSLFGWLTPLLVVVASVITDRYGSELYRPRYGPPQCWMSNSYGRVLFFTAPMCLVVLVDIVLYCVIIVRVAILSRQTARARNTCSEKVVLSIKLLLTLGVLWLFAVLGAFTESSVVICVFSNVVNTSQGIFVFAIFFCANPRVTEILKCSCIDKLRSRIASGGSSLQTSTDAKQEVAEADGEMAPSVSDETWMEAK